MKNRLAALLLSLAAAAQAASPMAVRVLDWMLPVPANWTPQMPSSDLRLAQFTIRSEGGAADAAVFYFGQGSGGSVEASPRKIMIQEWQNTASLLFICYMLIISKNSNPTDPNITWGSHAASMG